MSDWQERITFETAPAIRVEHELRYRIAAPLILAGDPWADLGCGNGLAAAAALGDSRPAHAVLVDIDQAVVARAASALELTDATAVTGDLTDPRDLQRIGDALVRYQGEPVVTCFEVVEHLSSFVELIEWAGMLAHDHGATFVISVPNDAFWSIQNPHHRSSWSEGAFEALRELLPPQRTLLRQVAVSGSAVVRWDSPPKLRQLSVQVGGTDAVATHFIAAFGPRHDDLQTAALANQTDATRQRRWERERESNLAIAQKVVVEQEATIADQRGDLRERIAQFDEWRTYIHELERELGRPLSGASAEDQPGAATEASSHTPSDSSPQAEPPA